MQVHPSVTQSMPAAGQRREGNLSLALKDLFTGLMCFHIWSTLAWQEIRLRYRRSTLGPLWLTLSTGIMVGTMGPLYGKLFGQPIGNYFVYLAVSIVTWTLISQSILECCNAFIGAEGFIKQIKLPLSLHVFRVVWRGLIVFAHNLAVIAVVFVFLPPPFGASVLLFPLGVLIVAVNAVWVGVVLGLICARFRDFPQIVSSLVGIAFFATPIMWQPAMLGKHAWKVNFNPFYHAMEMIRGPLLGAPPHIVSWIAMLVITIGGYSLMLWLFSRYRARIAYWV